MFDMMANEIAEIENVDSSFASHEFTLSFSTSEIRFEVVKMKDSTFIWIGDTHKAKFMDLSFGIPSTSSTSVPATTKILGIASTHSVSELMAERLSKKLKKPVYVSFNMDFDRNELLEKIEERLVEEIGLNNELF